MIWSLRELNGEIRIQTCFYIQNNGVRPLALSVAGVSKRKKSEPAIRLRIFSIVFLCTKMDGKFENPLLTGIAVFKIEWRANKRTWKSCQIMTEWLTIFNDKIVVKEEKWFYSPHPQSTFQTLKYFFLN